MDLAIESAIKSLKQRRDEVDKAIRALEGVDGRNGRTAQHTPVVKKVTASKSKPMSAAIKAKLRAAYAANHPGWKPKKK